MEPPSESSAILQFPPPTVSSNATAMASPRRPRISSPQGQRRDPPSPPVPSSACKPSKAHKGLISFDELPEWHQDNDWSYIHNESVNIYSHLIPAIVFLLGEGYIIGYLMNRYSNITGSDIFIFTFFLLTAVICLGLSATYHTLMNHSKEVENLWLRFDLVGIVVLTLGDFVSGIYMVFWCEPVQRRIYWSMIGGLGSITIFIMANPRFQSPNHRLFRTLAFVTTGMSGFAPLIHGCKMFGISQMMKQSGLPYYLVEGFFLLLGALIYGTKFPERHYPGKFDIVGSSHQLFHILVVFATVTQLIAILKAFDYNCNNRICLSP